jgi:hypothetical protein
VTRCKLTLLMSLFVAVPSLAAEFTYKDQLLGELVQQIPDILKTYDAETGHFGEGIWICTDQNAMFSLAVAYSHQAPGNRYFKDKQVLETIMKAGDVLIADADKDGKWVFRKKDGSTWGKIWMPWTYSRWVRTFMLVRDDMPADRREAWARALTLGYSGISREQLGHVHNIPTHHAMGLYVAGKTLDRPEWCKQATEFMVKVAKTQFEGGYWSEDVGPVVRYNFVYIDALGTYYSLSGDQRVLPAIEKAIRFHCLFTYPDGSIVETIDERNPYHEGVYPANVGFTLTPAGRALLQTLWTKLGKEPLPPDLIASLLLHGQEGPTDRSAVNPGDSLEVLTEKGVDRAAVMRRGPWFVCVSAYTAPISKSRWIQDRQNLVSIYHEKAGLILGGGNTKLQPAWSNFTVGDVTLLKHKPGDENPDFVPKGPLFHVPSEAKLIREPQLGLDLTYGKQSCRIRVQPTDDHKLELVLLAPDVGVGPVTAHLTLMPHLKQPLTTATGLRIKLADAPNSWTPAQVAGRITHGAVQLLVPGTASLFWPALPHNPYRKDGHADTAEGRIEIRLPFDRQHTEYTVTLKVPT